MAKRYVAKADIAWPDDKGTGNKVRWKQGEEIDDPKVGAQLAERAKELVEVVEASDDKVELPKEVVEKVRKKKKK